jgi:hypothetical protein
MLAQTRVPQGESPDSCAYNLFYPKTSIFEQISQKIVMMQNNAVKPDCVRSIQLKANLFLHD